MCVDQRETGFSRFVVQSDARDQTDRKKRSRSPRAVGRGGNAVEGTNSEAEGNVATPAACATYQDMLDAPE
ncbi:MAG: hypothetical protein OXC65_15740, partial [Thiotrichales bacterium]|nr:hypothetical protein [Thiotrichales bacterium]